MSNEGQAVPDETDAAVQYDDGRVLVDHGELHAAMNAVRKAVTEDTARWEAEQRYRSDGPKVLAEDQAKAVAIAVLRAINLKRCGHPEGTVAVDDDGRTARRYYSARKGRNVWLITEPPSDKGVEIDDADRLDFNYKVVHQPAWVIDAPVVDE